MPKRLREWVIDSGISQLPAAARVSTAGMRRWSKAGAMVKRLNSLIEAQGFAAEIEYWEVPGSAD
jgi:hypothetical protein